MQLEGEKEWDSKWQIFVILRQDKVTFIFFIHDHDGSCVFNLLQFNVFSTYFSILLSVLEVIVVNLFHLTAGGFHQIDHVFVYVIRNVSLNLKGSCFAAPQLMVMQNNPECGHRQLCSSSF